MDFLIGSSLKLFRTEAGMTQKELADQLFVSDKTISSYENGHNEPDLSTLQKMARCFGVTVSKIMERSEALMQTRKTQFYLEAMENQLFEGYTMGDTWNGFECPFFEKEVGLKIVDAYNQVGIEWEEDYNAWYDEKSDSFYFQSSKEESAEQYEGFDFMFQGKKHHVYPIGAHGWVWGEEK